MIIDCPYCDVTVDAKEQGKVTRYEERIPD